MPMKGWEVPHIHPDFQVEVTTPKKKRLEFLRREGKGGESGVQWCFDTVVLMLLIFV